MKKAKRDSMQSASDFDASFAVKQSLTPTRSNTSQIKVKPIIDPKLKGSIQRDEDQVTSRGSTLVNGTPEEDHNMQRSFSVGDKADMYRDYNKKGGDSFQNSGLYTQDKGVEK